MQGKKKNIKLRLLCTHICIILNKVGCQDLVYLEYDSVDWIQLAQNINQWTVFVKFRVPNVAGNLLVSEVCLVVL